MCIRDSFKTKHGMKIHAASCPFNYGNTSEYFSVEEILAVYGKASRKLFLIKWEGCPESENSWVPEHSLLQDGCKESIDDFWEKSGINPAKDFFPDSECRPRCWMCGYACSNPAMRFLKAHITVKGHNWYKHRTHLTAKADVKRDKLEAAQNRLPKVCWLSLIHI